MWCGPRCWLTTLRARRRRVLGVWLPIFVLSAAAGPACAAMHAREPIAKVVSTAPHAAQAPAAHGHHDHGASHDSQPASTEPPPCPHCPLAGAANVGSDTCAAAESPADHGGFVPAKDTSQRPQLALAPNWLLPAARASPPLIANLPPRSILPVAAVPLRVTHCVLLI
jgi:hypothetical protein